MHSVRILADDLTGALDAAAPFAAAGAPLPVRWQPDGFGGAGSFAHDSESRDRMVDLRPALAALAEADVAFKKIDSLLRGTTLDEIRACVASDRFRSVVIASAFPDQNRITRDGRQLWRPGSGDSWRPTEADLRTVDLPTGRIGVGARDLVGDGVFLCDAVSAEDLDGVVEAGRRLPPPVLWIGTAGLARALAGPGHPPQPPRGPLLVLVGSHHPVTLGQMDVLAGAHPDAVIRLGLDDPPADALQAVAARSENGPAAALVFALADGTGAATAGPLFDRVFEDLPQHVVRPATLLVTGGSTLHRLVRRLGAERLMVEGEWRAGIPISTLTGCAWAGTRVVSKSGGFGSSDVLLDLIRDLEEFQT
jgi:uncharacterized protein YgbK (DUF1537 family)